MFLACLLLGWLGFGTEEITFLDIGLPCAAFMLFLSVCDFDIIYVASVGSILVLGHFIFQPPGVFLSLKAGLISASQTALDFLQSMALGYNSLHAPSSPCRDQPRPWVAVGCPDQEHQLLPPTPLLPAAWATTWSRMMSCHWVWTLPVWSGTRCSLSPVISGPITLGWI